MIRYRPHKVSGSREFQSGIPGDWPQVEEEVPADRKLSAEELDQGFSLITPEEHQAIRTANRQAYNAWQASRLAQEEQGVSVKRTDTADALNQLIAIRDAPGDLTLRQVSNAVKLLAKVLIVLIQQARELFERS